MKWNEEREKIEQLIQANLDCWYEEARFYERLLEILDTSATRVSFLKKACQEVSVYPNPWLRDDLVKFVNTLERTGNIL